MIINAISDMLTDTSMKIDNKKIEINMGDPQESFLSPVLFNLFINNLLIKKAIRLKNISVCRWHCFHLQNKYSAKEMHEVHKWMVFQ